jgi:hypothetical protein
MNDSSVSVVSTTRVLQQQAYILFYVKINSPTPQSPVNISPKIISNMNPITGLGVNQTPTVISDKDKITVHSNAPS